MAILNFASFTHQLDDSDVTNSTTTAGTISPFAIRSCISDSAISTAKYGVLSFPANSEVWLSFYFYHISGQNAQNSHNWIIFYGGGTELIRIRTTSSNVFQVQYWDGASWVSFTGDFASPNFNPIKRIDIRVNLSDTGNIEVYSNGLSIYNFSGDTLHTAQTTLDSVRLQTNPFTTLLRAFSSVFVADEDTRTIEAQTLHVTGNGFYTAWNGDETSIDEEIISGIDFIDTVTPDAIETFTKAAVDATFDSGYDVVGVAIKTLAKRSVGGPQSLQHVVRSNSVDAVSGTLPLEVGYENKFSFFAQDPDTLAAWTPAALTAAQIGVKAIS